MKKYVLVFLITTLYLQGYSQVYSGKNGSVNLLGKAPKETITAKSKALMGKLDAASREFNFRQNLSQFAFSQGDMQKKDAEEMYWQTDKYPYADFQGKIINSIDLSKNGTYDVTAIGSFRMHGVVKELKIPAQVQVKDGTMEVSSTFNIFLSDFDIEIPRLVALKVAEEFQASISLTLTR